MAVPGAQFSGNHLFLRKQKLKNYSLIILEGNFDKDRAIVLFAGVANYCGRPKSSTI